MHFQGVASYQSHVLVNPKSDLAGFVPLLWPLVNKKESNKICSLVGASSVP